MDDTQAAATVGETENLRAWSQEGEPTELVDYRPRSWRLPILALLAVLGIIAAALYLFWPVKPQESARKPQVASTPVIQPSPPAQQVTPDQRFINLLKQRGVKVVSPPAALKGAQDVCRLENAGHSAREIAQAFADVTPGATVQTEGVFVMTAQEVYCP